MKRLPKLLLILLVAGAAVILLGMLVAQHKGYVLVAYKGFRYESTLWATLALLAVLWLLFIGLRYLVRLLAMSGGMVNPWSRRNARRRVRLASEQGVLDLAEGRWPRALRHLKRAAEGDPQPLIYYLGAARAAQKIGQHEEAEHLLERALERQPHAELAIALAHADLQRNRGEAQGALETLQAMRERHPRDHQVLRQLLDLHESRGDWLALVGLLPEVRKQKVLPESQLAELELRAWGARLRQAGEEGLNQGETALQPLTHVWQQLSATQRGEPRLVLAFAEQLRLLGAEEEAEEAARGAIKRGYDVDLVRFYGLLHGRDVARQLQTAEEWLKAHPDDGTLLLTLGRLCLRNRLWGKAREYFESSLSQHRNPEICGELARLLAQLGEVQHSNRLLQEGLGLLDQRLPALPLPAEKIA